MNLEKLNDKEYALGAIGLPKQKDVAKKVNEIIDYVNNNAQPKIYKAVLNQSGTSDPTVNVIVNTLGDITISRDNSGYYTVSSNGLFTLNKTNYNITPAPLGISGNNYFIGIHDYEDTSNFGITTAKSQNIEGSFSLVLSDSILYQSVLTIEVYN